MKKISIKPYVDVFLNEELKKLYVSRNFKDGSTFNVYELTDVGLYLIKQLKESIKEDVLFQLIEKEFPNDVQEAIEILNYMKEEMYLDYYEESLEQLIHEQHERILPIWAEFETLEKNRFEIYESLKKKTVGIIGCGTIGTGVAVKLALSGIRNFVLMDGDKIEMNNLSRQPMFSHSLLGEGKVGACKKMIEDRQRHAQVTIHEQKVISSQDLEVFRQCDLVVLCADENYDFLSGIVEDFSYQYNIPVSFGGGYVGNNSKIFPLVVPKKTNCFTCLKATLSNFTDVGVRIGGNHKISGMVQLSEIISSIVSFEILKFLCDTEQDYFKNKMRMFRMKDYDMQDIDCIPQPDCERCNSVTEQQTV